jgi:hypothetical protein
MAEIPCSASNAVLAHSQNAAVVIDKWLSLGHNLPCLG